MTKAEQLGVVTTKSGGLIVIDTGYLGIWSHDRPPTVPNGELPTDEDIGQANAFVDFRITGPDAETAGKLLEMSWNPYFVYDKPPVHDELEEKFTDLVRKHRLDARLEVVSPRISHRERVDLALKYGAGAGEIEFHGIFAVVVEGVLVG